MSDGPSIATAIGFTIPQMVAPVPVGMVTFLFTDIEGSTRLWEAEPVRMADALARHDRLCRTAVESNCGRVVKMTGDGLYAVFDDPGAAIATVLELQRGMAAIAADCGIPFKVRCGLHAGVPEARDGDYFGSEVNRAARIMGAAHGGQVLLSQAVVERTRERMPDGVNLLHLGRVRLRDLSSPEDIWQLLHADLPQTFPALRSLDSTPNNLPQQVTSFIGRQKEIAEVKRLLGTARLVTLTGAGGCGKTRLAIQVVAELLERYADGVWLVELAALSDPGLVPQTVAKVLGLREERGTSLMHTLTQHLKSRHLLIVLDNAEHLLTACAQVVDSIIRQCPQVVVLVSSREALGIGGEQLYRVPSLSMPDPKRDSTVDSVARCESVRLFVERAQVHQPQFVITRQNAPAVASLCYRLDGIPLALELAAARVRSMSVEEVDRRLDHRFQLLTGGSRTALPRQQTLRSAIDWSYDLLDATEQALLCRLSVFSGGFMLEAAEQVCGDESTDTEEMLDLVTSLVDKSLIVAEEREGATRYRLLETIREYAREGLSDPDESARYHGRHLAYFLAMAEAAEPELKGPDQQAWMDRLEFEHDNLREALRWSAGRGGQLPEALRLAGALSRFWYVHGSFDEGRRWLSRLLAEEPGRQFPPARAKALFGAGALAWLQGDHPKAERLHEECLAMWRQMGDRQGVATALNSLGLVARDQGRDSAARERFEESYAIFEELGDRRGVQTTLNNLGLLAKDRADYPAARELLDRCLVIARQLGNRHGIAAALINLGNVACDQGDLAAAAAHFEEGLAHGRELGDRLLVAGSLNNLGNVACTQGDYPKARALHEEGLAIRRELGARQGIADSLDGFARIAHGEADFARAALLWGALERLREEIGAPVLPNKRPLYESEITAARAALNDDTAFNLAWREGRSMTQERAIEYALGSSPP